MSQSLTGYAIHNRGGGYDNDLPQQAAIFIVHLNFVGKLVFYRNCLNNFLRLKKIGIFEMERLYNLCKYLKLKIIMWNRSNSSK